MGSLKCRTSALPPCQLRRELNPERHLRSCFTRAATFASSLGRTTSQCSAFALHDQDCAASRRLFFQGSGCRCLCIFPEAGLSGGRPRRVGERPVRLRAPPPAFIATMQPAGSRPRQAKASEFGRTASNCTTLFRWFDCGDHADERGCFGHEHPHSLFASADIGRVDGNRNAELHRALCCARVLDVLNVERSRRVETQDATKQAGITLKQVHLLMANASLGAKK